MLRISTIPHLMRIAAKLDLKPVIEKLKEVDIFENGKAAIEQLDKEKVGILGMEVLTVITPQFGKIADDIVPLVAAYKNVSREEAEKALLDTLRMKGWLLDDAKVIRTIDESNQYLCVKLKGDGEIDGHNKSSVKAEKEFEVLAAHTMEKLREAGEKVLSGDVEIAPFFVKGKSACTYCPYGDVCGFDLKLGQFEYRELDDTIAFMQEMERKEGNVNGQGE